MKYCIPLLTMLFMLACSISYGTETAPIPSPVETKKILATATPSPWTASVRLPVVNVRAEPSGTVLRTLRAGDHVTLLLCRNDWCELADGGWIFRGCLSIHGNLGCTEAK